MKHKFIIGTGYVAHESNAVKRSDFYSIWYANTIKYAPESIIYVINGNGLYFGGHGSRFGRWIDLDKNLGHVHHLINEGWPYFYCGWSMSILLLAMIAYHNDCDLIFKEQDCLAFGDWVQQLYRDCEGREMVTGKSDIMGIEQSLFLIKKTFLLEFVRWYMFFNQSDAKLLPEEKFRQMIQASGGRIGYLSFGYGRNRPINYDASCFYIQQINDTEMGELKTRGLI